MKNKLLIILLLYINSVICQNTIINDSIIKVIYNNQNKNNKEPAFFINDKLIEKKALKTFDTNEIESMNVEKEEFVIDNVKYYGKIIIKTKENYQPKFISLNNLKLKYTKIKQNSTIFLIDNEIINSDYNQFLINENYILSIEVDKFENKFENLKFNYINIITKSEENIKKSKEIIIR